MTHGLARNGRPRRGPTARRVEERFAIGAAPLPEPGLAEFVSSVRSRGAPREGLRQALDIAAAVHMVNRAFRSEAADGATGRAAGPWENRVA